MDYPPAQWRLILSPPSRGAWNMAIDEAILEFAGRKEVLPTLRLYAWEPACLSIGYAQPVTDVDRHRLIDRGWELVRRPTGGKAILHTDELTYSVAGPVDDTRLTGSVLESYRRLADALQAALKSLGLNTQIKDRARSPLESRARGPVCFEAPSDYEILVGEKKLVGSAQARRKQGVLQHGSLPLYGDLQRITQALHFTDEASRLQATERLIKRATTVESVLGYQISWGIAAQAFKIAFEKTLNLELRPEELTPREQTRAWELVSEKYDHPTWMERI